MKKVFFALALMTFVGSVATTAYAASNGVSTEIKKDDKKKKKKKKGACCSAKEGASSCAKPGTEGKSCCTKKQ
ncbi:MAG: hypothetical protein ACK46O_06585 [Flavobacteriia bacterium]|jgi:hypothetical protein